MIVLSGVAALLILLLILIFMYSLISGVVPMPSSRRERETLCRILNDYSEDDRFAGGMRIVDLGGGWGGLSRFLAGIVKGSEVMSMELSPVPCLYGRVVSSAFGYGNVRHSRKDFLKETLRDRTVYVAYLSGPAMRELRHRFEEDRPREGLLISIAFAMPCWTAVSVEYAGGKRHCPVYVYEF